MSVLFLATPKSRCNQLKYTLETNLFQGLGSSRTRPSSDRRFDPSRNFPDLHLRRLLRRNLDGLDPAHLLSSLHHHYVSYWIVRRGLFLLYDGLKWATPKTLFLCFFKWARSKTLFLFFLRWAIPGLFFLYFRLSTQLTINKCLIKVCRWQISGVPRQQLYQLSHNHCPRHFFFICVFSKHYQWINYQLKLLLAGLESGSLYQLYHNSSTAYTTANVILQRNFN